jgi:two-component system, cell cycle sensor histidine kinase and response regulator CckA
MTGTVTFSSLDTLRSIGDGVIATDTEGRVVFANRVAELMTGWSEAEARGRPLSEVLSLIDQKSREPAIDPVARVLEEGGITSLPESVSLVRRDGSERAISDSCAPVLDAEGVVAGVVVVFRDVTEKERLEADLLNEQKLDSIGILAGGIAHDFNNLLTAIAGNITLSKMMAPATQEELMDCLTEAEAACLRATELTHQLLTFAKGGGPIKRITSLAALLRETAPFALAGSNVRCEFSIPDDLWPVEVDPTQIAQVINNLVINAKQAMPNGGTIAVQARNSIVWPEHAPPTETGAYVQVSIRDQGVGIPADHLPKIFVPYFTTKKTGTGLGLATSYSIVRNHHGYITVDSEVGVGTVFHVYLPASEASVEERVRPEPPVGKGRVLLMDDEDMVRKVTSQMLRQLGYSVDGATDGVEVIELYRKAKEVGQPYDLVIMDLTIPGGMGGRECIDKLRAIDPDAKAIVTSGYSDDPVMAEHERFGFSGVISKPWKIEALSETLRNVMSGSTA